MKKTLAAALIAATMVIPAGLTVGASLDATNFATDCNDDGTVEISDKVQYVGGTGTLNRNCYVSVHPTATLILKGVEITGTHVLVISGPPDLIGGAKSGVVVKDSVIDLGGALQISPGCCAGDPTIDDGKAAIVVSNSKFKADTIELTTSFDWQRGTIKVTSSELTANSTTQPGAGIIVRSSPVAGSNGRTRVTDSSFSAETGILLEASAGLLGGGVISVRNSTFDGGTTTITAGSFGASCRSTGSTPDIPCTP